MSVCVDLRGWHLCAYMYADVSPKLGDSFGDSGGTLLVNLMILGIVGLPAGTEGFSGRTSNPQTTELK